MKFQYYPETDSLYVEFKGGPDAETREVLDGLNVDLETAACSALISTTRPSDSTCLR